MTRLEKLIHAIHQMSNSIVDPSRAVWKNTDALMLVNEIQRLRRLTNVIPETALQDNWLSRVISYLNNQQLYDDANAFALLDEIGFFSEKDEECPYCGGTGEVEFQRECRVCGGQGVVKKDEQ